MEPKSIALASVGLFVLLTVGQVSGALASSDEHEENELTTRIFSEHISNISPEEMFTLLLRLNTLIFSRDDDDTISDGEREHRSRIWALLEAGRIIKAHCEEPNYFRKLNSLILSHQRPARHANLALYLLESEKKQRDLCAPSSSI